MFASYCICPPAKVAAIPRQPDKHANEGILVVMSSGLSTYSSVGNKSTNHIVLNDKPKVFIIFSYLSCGARNFSKPSRRAKKTAEFADGVRSR